MATTSAEMIAKIDVQILDAIENPKPDYKIGDKTITWSKWLAELRQLRRDYIENGDSEIDIITFEGFETDELGVIT